MNATRYPCRVLRHQVHVRRDQRAQVLAEGEVDRRAVVERADAHVEHVAGGLGGLLGEPPDEVGVQFPLLQHARPAARQPQQVARAPPVNRQERVEDGGDEDRAARVDLDRVVQLGGVRLVLDPLLLLLVVPADRVAQRAVRAAGVAELRRQLRQQVLGAQVPARVGDLVCQHLGKRKVLEQRHDVRERLVEREHVGVRRLHEILVEPVQQRVRRLVRDHVVGQAREHHPARKLPGAAVLRRREVTEQQRPFVAAVVRVGHPQRVGVDAKPRDVLLFPRRGLASDVPVRPHRLATQRALEPVDRGHHDRVDHLLVKLRVAFRRRQAVLREHFRVVEVDRGVVAGARRVEVHDLDVFAARPGFEVLPRHFVGDLADQRGLQLRRQARIERVPPQQPVGRPGRFVGRTEPGIRPPDAFDRRAAFTRFAFRHWWFPLELSADTPRLCFLRKRVRELSPRSMLTPFP